MRIVLSVEALEPVLTGIGRYTWELARRLPQLVRSVQFFRLGRLISDPASLLLPVRAKKPNRKRKWNPFRFPLPLWWRELRLRPACRGKIFHGCNYFLPSCADIGVVTVHDLSVFKFSETHPVKRIQQFEREFGRSISRAAHLITDSEAVRREVIEFLGWPPDKITTVPLGVSSEFAPRTSEALDPCMREYSLTANGYTFCVSTLEPRKKIENLLQAYKSLPNGLRMR